MFGSRRKRGLASPPLNKNNANPNAATAAAQAFLKNQTSNASLAAAAAGAALRSRPTTPISVADVQTKRMIRRAESSSSVGSSRNGSVRGKRPELERRGSSSSMTERTFRDPSPSAHVPSDYDAPPVPAIPKKLSNGHRRASSLEAPARLMSPPPKAANGRGSSLGPGNTASHSRRNGHGIHSLSSVQELSDSSGQQPRITSPANQNLVYDPNTRSFLPYAEILAIEERQRIQHAASLPVKKKRRDGPAQATGSHLTDRTMGSKPRGSAVAELEAVQRLHEAGPSATQVSTAKHEPKELTSVQEPVAVPKKKRPKKVVVASDSDSDQQSYIPQSSDNDRDFIRGAQTTRSSTQLVKKPSVVREEREKEEEEEQGDKQIKTAKLDGGSRTFSPTPLPRSVAGRNFSRHQTASPSLEMPEREKAASPSQQTPSVPTIVSNTPADEGGLATNGSGRDARFHSVSPSRKAQFAQTQDTLVVRHDPPGRSVSPRKSALKQLSNSSRDQSPIGSDHGANDLQLLPRKKAVRVSFDETNNVIVGEAAGQGVANSPVAQSPQAAKRNWFSLGGRSKKKDALANEQNDDEVMQPRPALPSFGSVRGMNPRREPVEERQLIKPADHPGNDTPLPSAPSTPQLTDQVEESEIPIGQSSDHIVGALFSQDAAYKHEANISKSREPLPPQVTSVEGTGYHSDTDSTISAVVDTQPEDKETSPHPDIHIDHVKYDSGNASPNPNSEIASTKANGRAPQILLTQPTPTLENTDRKGWFDMPGGFPSSGVSDSEGDDQDEVPKIVEHQVTELTPAMVGIAEPFEGPEPGSPVIGDIAFENSFHHDSIQEQDEDSDTSGVYSDAAEDLSDVEGDGFMSLDAVVESPVLNSTTPGLAITTPPESPTIHLAKQRAYQRSALSKEAHDTKIDEGWDKAQEYWKGLSADKKRRLEREAREESEDSESTIEAKPLPKQKKTRVAAVRPAEVPILQQPKPQTRNDRTYQIQPGTKAGKDGYTPPMRSSMRAEQLSTASQVPDTHMRRSMRGQGSVRSSLRDEQQPEPRAALQRKSRPMSLPATAETKPVSAAVQMHIKALSAASASAAARKTPTPAAPLRRRGSGDSDSSFKRARPAEVTTFRRSMRGPNEAFGSNRPTSPIGSSKFSLRSMSPTESQGRQPFNAGPPPISTQMRRSMRNSQESTPSLRNSKPERTKSPIRLPGFGRSSSGKPAKSNPAPPRSSRFADSSDDEDNAPVFRSRFVDSSDEDDGPSPLPKTTAMRGSMRTSQSLRGIPRRSGVDDGDSSDLPDSDDEKSPAAVGMKVAKPRQNGVTPPALESPAIKRSGSGREAMSPTYTTTITASRPQHTRRGSLMSILRRKKPDDSAKVRKSDAESPARRDTPLERSKSDLIAVKRSESYNALTSRPMSPKLQKRNPSGTWPLSSSTSTPVVADEQDERPFTADAAEGVNGGEQRPDIGTRRFTDLGSNAIGVNGAGAPKKKKKFQALRKMFRLDD